MPVRNVDLISSVELVYTTTRQAILSGEFAPGSPLRLQELADRNGVSMIPVREALRKLESEGFVETTPNRGARVAPLSHADMLEVYRVRIILEVEALRQAIPKIDADRIARGFRLNDEVHALAMAGDAAFHGYHREFHFLLYEPSESRWLLRLIGMVWDHTERYRLQMAPRVDYRESHRQHQQILDALAAGETSRTLTALEEHLSQSRDLLSAMYEESPDRP